MMVLICHHKEHESTGNLKQYGLHDYLGPAETRWLYKISLHEITTIDGLGCFKIVDICEDFI